MPMKRQRESYYGAIKFLSARAFLCSPSPCQPSAQTSGCPRRRRRPRHRTQTSERRPIGYGRRLRAAPAARRAPRAVALVLSDTAYRLFGNESERFRLPFRAFVFKFMIHQRSP
ncbi:hypothetical protein EVAR_23867_1 [Eumeta japonica]|uniref:Uncharacterized protein n=1 Tax=Eumeta variegata TaxID=151549 RepID=A0A4C1V613_EUMVA|nr:hypothetical protein EVAR_23867_1 [Eumeta japonica]